MIDFLVSYMVIPEWPGADMLESIIGFTSGGFHYTQPYPQGVATVPRGKITSMNFKKSLLRTSVVTVNIPGQPPLELNVTYSGVKSPEMVSEIQARIV